jgi:hypothetical protein
MASNLYEIPKRGDHSPLLPVKFPPASASAARLYQFPELTTGIETEQTEYLGSAGCVRGICFALALETVAGIGVYLLWNLCNMLR